MNDKFILSKNNVYIGILILIILTLLIYVKFYDNLCLECIFKKKENMQNASKNENPNYETINYKEIQDENPIILGNNAMEIIKDKKSKIIDRVYDQLDYPYKKDGFYDQSWYPNLKLPFQVISSGGWRNIPTLGGTQIPIMNPPVPLDISDTNIAPRNIRIINQEKPELIGSVYKIFGNANQMMNLYRMRNKNNYFNYYTVNQQGVLIPVITKNRTDEPGDGDTVFLKGIREPYRVSIYNLDNTPVYIPFN